MSELKEWVRELTVLVILGTCLELLIPMGSMKKYIRMTMGLVVVLAVVSPIAAFLGRPVVIETLALGETGDGRLPSVGQIMVQAKQFRERNEALSLSEARGRLAQAAGEAASGVAGVAGARAEVSVREQQGEYQITGVTVVLTPGARPGAVKPVEPVRPSGAPAPAKQPPAEPTEAETPLAGAVRQAVAAKLGVEPQTVRVLIDRK